MIQYTEICQCNLPYKQTEKKDHMITSLDAEKAFNKIQHPCMIKVLERTGIQGICLNIYSKPSANINLNREKFKTNSLKSGTRQGCPLSQYLFNTVLEVLASAIGQQKIKQKQIAKRSQTLTIC